MMKMLGREPSKKSLAGVSGKYRVAYQDMKRRRLSFIFIHQNAAYTPEEPASAVLFHLYTAPNGSNQRENHSGNLAGIPANPRGVREPDPRPHGPTIKSDEIDKQ